MDKYLSLETQKYNKIVKKMNLNKHFPNLKPIENSKKHFLVPIEDTLFTEESTSSPISYNSIKKRSNSCIKLIIKKPNQFSNSIFEKSVSINKISLADSLTKNTSKKIIKKNCKEPNTNVIYGIIAPEKKKIIHRKNISCLEIKIPSVKYL